MIDWYWHIDGWIVAAGMLCAGAAALLGNFMVLRRMSLLGDAISHAVLPGLAAAFLFTSSRASLPMFVGAAIVGVLTAMLTEWIRSYGNVDEGASMGVVFTALFAIGLIVIVQAADRVDLDPDCVLHGAIENTPLKMVAIGDWAIPQPVLVLAPVFLVNLLFVVLLYKELKISSFDPSLATTVGLSAKWMHYLLMTLVAITAVACFESVGSILVVAMLIVPPAAAHLLTDRLPLMIVLSLVIACASAFLGHIGAIVVPQAFGLQATTSASMMAVATGGFFVLAMFCSPRQGLISRAVRRSVLSARILAEDILGLLYRHQERAPQAAMPLDELQRLLLARTWPTRMALRYLTFNGSVAQHADGYRLTDEGSQRAAGLLRAHRLWEQYLVNEADVDPTKTHLPAERLEHFTGRDLRRRLDDETSTPEVDPHGKPIPPEAKS